MTIDLRYYTSKSNLIMYLVKLFKLGGILIFKNWMCKPHIEVDSNLNSFYKKKDDQIQLKF